MKEKRETKVSYNSNISTSTRHTFNSLMCTTTTDFLFLCHFLINILFLLALYSDNTHVSLVKGPAAQVDINGSFQGIKNVAVNLAK